jgi:cytochrome c-type biogenesis protein CcmF
MPLGMALKWKSDSLLPIKNVLITVAALSIVCGCAFAAFYAKPFRAQAVLAVSVSVWALLLIAYDLRVHMRHTAGFLPAVMKLSRSYKGMILAHVGFVLSLSGMALTSIYSTSMDVRMDIGKKVEMANLVFVLNEVTRENGPNYSASIGHLSVYHNDIELTQLHPEKRSYNSDRANRMTEAAIDAGIFADIYVSMGEALDKEDINSAWAMRLHYKPFVRWVWSGALVMALGAFFSVSDRRYRRPSSP